MATLIWKGDAAPVAQVTACTVGGTIDANQNFTITIGSKSLGVVAGGTTASAAVGAIVTAWNALSANAYPEFSGIAITNNLDGSFTLTGTPGVPFTVVLSTTEAGGGASDSETFTQTTPTAASGPQFWSEKKNWSSGAVPANGDDVVVQNSSASILYGLDQSSVALASLTIDQSFNGVIGMPRTNALGYVEYRSQYLRITAAAVTIGGGSGAGSGRIKLDTGSGQCALNVLNSGSPAETGIKSMLWKGTHASNTLTVEKGSVGAAVFAGEAATILTLKEGFRTNVSGDCDVQLGVGCTLTNIVKTGGNLEINSSFTTLTHTAGETTIAAGTPAAMTITGGSVRYRTAGTYAQATVASGGELDFRQDLQSRSGTNTTLRAGAVLRDPAKTVTFTNPIAVGCALSDVTLDLGNTFNLQRT
jgi:trimeric autotransporter adhesin